MPSHVCCVWSNRGRYCAANICHLMASHVSCVWSIRGRYCAADTCHLMLFKLFQDVATCLNTTCMEAHLKVSQDGIRLLPSRDTSGRGNACCRQQHQQRHWQLFPAGLRRRLAQTPVSVHRPAFSTDCSQAPRVCLSVRAGRQQQRQWTAICTAWLGHPFVHMLLLRSAAGCSDVYQRCSRPMTCCC